MRRLEAVADRLPAIFAALLVLIVGWVVAGLVRGWVQRLMARTSTEGHVDFVVARLAHIGAILLTIVIALGVAGVSAAALVASLGVASFAVGFAFKDVLGNFLAGVLVLVQRPFTVGEEVRIGDIQGVVVDIRVRDTVLRAVDGTLIFMPNNTVYTSPITNLSAAPERRMDLIMALPADADVANAVKAAAKALAEHSAVLDEPPPEVLVDALAPQAVTLTCRFWIDQHTTSWGAARAGVGEALELAMKAAGVELARAPSLAVGGGGG